MLPLGAKLLLHTGHTYRHHTYICIIVVHYFVYPSILKESKISGLINFQIEYWSVKMIQNSIFIILQARTKYMKIISCSFLTARSKSYV